MKTDRSLRVQLSNTASVFSIMGKGMWNEKKNTTEIQYCGQMWLNSETE